MWAAPQETEQMSQHSEGKASVPEYEKIENCFTGLNNRLLVAALPVCVS